MSLPTITKNLGLVQAIKIDSAPPSNTAMLWYDTNVNYHKYYDTVTSSWIPLSSSSSLGLGTPNVFPVIATESGGEIRTFKDGPIRIGGYYTKDVYGRIDAEVGSPSAFTFEARSDIGAVSSMGVYNTVTPGTGLAAMYTFNPTSTIGSQISAEYGAGRVQYWSAGVIQSEVQAGTSGNVFSSSVANIFTGKEISFSGIAGITNDRVTYVNSSGKLVTSNVTSSVLDYIANLTSDVQVQLNALQTGQFWKSACRYATTGDITHSGLATQAGGDWPSTLTAGDRILDKDNSTGSLRGIWIASAGSWTRATDFDAGSDNISGATVHINEGSTLSDQKFTCTTNDPIVIGTTALTFASVGGSTYLNGAGLTLTGNTFSIAAGAITNSMLAGSIAASKLVGTDITTVGIITTGGLGTGATLGSVTVNIASSAVGDIYYGGASNVLTRLAAVAVGSVLVSGGVTTAPAWSTSPAISTSLTVPKVIGGTGNQGTTYYSTSQTSHQSSLSTGAHIFYSYTTEELMRMGNNGGGELLLFAAGNSTSGSNYFLRATPAASYLNATSDLRLQIGGATIALCSSTTFTVQSGKIFKLGNAAVTGLVAGALAATTNASIVIYDSAGQAYRIPCII